MLVLSAATHTVVMLGMEVPSRGMLPLLSSIWQILRGWFSLWLGQILSGFRIAWDLVEEELVDVMPDRVVHEDMVEVVPEKAILKVEVFNMHVDKLCQVFYCLQNSGFKVVMIKFVEILQIFYLAGCLQYTYRYL